MQLTFREQWMDERLKFNDYNGKYMEITLLTKSVLEEPPPTRRNLGARRPYSSLPVKYLYPPTAPCHSQPDPVYNICVHSILNVYFSRVPVSNTMTQFFILFFTLIPHLYLEGQPFGQCCIARVYSSRRLSGPPPIQ